MFDSPTRDLCSARRIATNTPLQALVTLNDPVYVECAQALARRATESSQPDAADSADVIARMYRAVTQRMPGEVEARELNQLYGDLYDRKTNDTIDQNAMSIVANTIMNLDRAVTK